MDDLETDNPAAPLADNSPSAGPAAAASGTGATGGQVQGGTPADDLFKGVDPNKLPPEVRAHYDGMLRDYREKTGKLSETIKTEAAKATETYRQKAEMYEKFAQQEDFVRQWNEYVQKVNTAGQQNPGDPMLTQLKEQIQQVTQKLQFQELQQVTEAFADATNDKGEKLHPEFDKFNSIVIGQVPGGDGEEFSFLRACIELAPGESPQEKLTNGYKTAEESYKAIFEEGRKAGMGRLQQKVLNGTQPPSNTPANLSLTDKPPKNAREALALAKRGVMVSRE